MGCKAKASHLQVLHDHACFPHGRLRSLADRFAVWTKAYSIGVDRSFSRQPLRYPHSEVATAHEARLATLSAEASGFLVGPTVFKTDVGAQAPRRVRFPSASATVDPYFASVPIRDAWVQWNA